jgi:hypothetical protein
MNDHYIRDERRHERVPPGSEERLGVRFAVLLVVLMFLIAAFTARESNSAERGTPTSGVAYDLIRSGQFVKRNIATSEACDAELAAARAKHAATKTSGSERWICRQDRWVNVSYGAGQPTPVTCQAPPPPRQVACPSGTTGTWSQTASVGAAPSCTLMWLPASPSTGACTPSPSSEVTLNWTAPTEYTNGARLTDIRGYKILYGTRSAELNQTIETRNVTSHRIERLAPGTYYFEVRAIAANGNESASSNRVTKVVQ